MKFLRHVLNYKKFYCHSYLDFLYPFLNEILDCLYFELNEISRCSGNIFYGSSTKTIYLLTKDWKYF